jgi:dTDP-4-amino-4,6-dideoxygalactose transaminase
VLDALKDSVRRVIVPAYTCVAVPNAIATAGLPIKWVDIAGLNIDMSAVVREIRAGDALLLQHTYGISPAPLEPVPSGVYIIEDRAHRFDALGISGDAAFFSLEHSKVLSAGRGGLIWIRDQGLRRRILDLRAGLPLPANGEMRLVARTSAAQRLLAGLGIVPMAVKSLARRAAFRVPPISVPAHSEAETRHGRIEPQQMHPLAAALARQSLPRLRNDLAHRERIGAIYERILGSRIPDEARRGAAVVRMPVVVDDADAVRARVRERGVDLGERWFDATVHPRGSATTYRPGMAPHAEELVERILNLPLHALIQEEDAIGLARLVERSS